MGEAKSRWVGALAACILVLGAALALGFSFPGSFLPVESSEPAHFHVHEDGGLHWHAQAQEMPVAPAAGAPFSFGVAGDYGFSGDAQSVMTSMGSSGLDFVIALGDLAYSESSESTWCSFFESKVGDGRVIIIAGNHDTGESSGGNINTFRQHCNFGIDAPLTGDYGKEYYFDYPRTGPLVRFIGTGCGLDWVVDGGGYWSCDVGNSHYNFIRDAIDGARAVSIPWIAVYSHKPCISAHSYGCELGQAILDLVTSKRVDLLMSAHSHNYQRSKQLICATDNNYRPECVSHADTPYTYGDGTVVQIVGTGGRGLYPIENNADRPYFAVANSDTKGFQKFTVTDTSLHMEYVKITGSLVESYDVGSSGPDFSLSANPASVSFTAGQSAMSTIAVQSMGGFTGTVTLTTASAPAGVSTTCTPAAITGTETSTCTMTGSIAGSYTVTITGTSGSLVRTAAVSVTVTATPPSGPTARFSHAPSLPKVSEPVSFDATSSTDTDPGATLQARWDWETDGVWDTAFSPTLTTQHAFTTTGTYVVTLEIRDSNGLSDTEVRSLLVVPLESGEVGAPAGYGLIDPSKLVARGPIYVGSNAEFTAANGLRRGTGTLLDPYVISDWLIDGALYPSAQAMIHVEGTDAYVVIENNKIVNLADPNHWEAIQLGHWPAAISTLHVTIRHNHIENARHAYGIAVREGSRDIRVEANYVRLDANLEWVYGIATDRGVHDVTIYGNYVDAYTSGTFHTTGIHLSDTHVDDARRATGLVATRNTVVNATGGAIVSASSSGTVIGWNLLYMDYPGIKSVSSGFPRGVDTAWNSDGAVIVGNVIHTFESGILVGSDHGLILSNTIYNVNYGIFVPENGSMPGVSTYADTIYNTTTWNVAQGSIRIPSDFTGTVVDLGSGIRSTDLTPVLFVINGVASRVSTSWSGQLLNLSATVGGAVVFDTVTTAESQTIDASWTGSIRRFNLVGLSTSRVSFHLESGGDVQFTGSGFQPSTPYNLIRSNAGGIAQILGLQSTSSGGLALTIPGSEPSDFAVTTEGASSPWTIPVLLQAVPMLLPGMALALLLVSFVLARRRHRKKRRQVARSRGPSTRKHRDPEGTDDW